MKKRPPPFKKPKQSSGRGLGPLTKHLRALAAEIETTDNSFNLITRAEMLAMVVWKKALGWIEPAKKQGDAYYSRMESPNCADADILYNCAGDWKMTVDIMKKYRDLEGDINAEDFFTNEFLP